MGLSALQTKFDAVGLFSIVCLPLFKFIWDEKQEAGTNVQIGEKAPFAHR